MFSLAGASAASAGTIVFTAPANGSAAAAAPNIAWTTTGAITGDIECRMLFESIEIYAFQPCDDPPFEATSAVNGGSLDWLTLPTPNFTVDGDFTFSVRANFAPDPIVTQTLTFSRDTTGDPVTIVDPTTPTNDNTPTFVFSTGDSNPGTFACAIHPIGFVGSPTYTGCDSGDTFPALADGEWGFYVRHTDTLGNFGFDVVSIKIDTVPPTITVNRPTPGFVMESNVLDLDFGAVDPPPNTGATFTCRFNAEAFVPCDSAFTSRTLADGSYTLEIRATDGAGNVGTKVVPFSVDTSLGGGGPTVPSSVKAKKLSGKVTGSKYKLKIQGSFAVPAGFDPAVACKGTVRFSITGRLKGKKSKSFVKNAAMKPVGRNCVYNATFSIPKAYKGKRLVTRTAFKGNALFGGFSKTATIRKA